MVFATLRRRLRQIAWVLLGLFVLGFIAATAMRVYVGREYARGLQAIQAAGIPLTVEELKAQYESQCPSMEAFALYERAFAMMGDSSALDDLAEMDDESVYKLSQGDQQRLHKFVEANADSIAILGEATSHACARFPLEQLEFGISTDPDQVQIPARCRKAIRILRFAALDSLTLGDRKGAAGHVLSLIGISRHLLDAPVFVGGPVAAFGIAIVNGIVATGMRHGLWDESEIEAMVNGLIGVEKALIAARNQTGEFAVYRQLLSPTMSSRELGSGVLAIVLDMDDDNITAIAMVLPWAVSGIGVVASYVRFQDLLFLEMIRAEAARLGVPGNMPFSGIEPEISSRLKNQSIARVRLLLTACAVEAYGLKYANYPDTLTALDETQRNSVGEDPYTGEPIHYRREGQGFVLYCVGENLADDGGDKHKDIVFQVTR